MFGFAKVRYRGLKKNAHRLIVTSALANLFMARRHLLRCQGRRMPALRQYAAQAIEYAQRRRTVAHPVAG